ncbi:MAG: glycosyl hydrolase family 18 protein [Oscillospiraceae bacterium]
MVICGELYRQERLHRYWDDEAKAPWVYDGSTFLSYDDEQSIACKVDYIKERGLKGLMFWEYFYDPPIPCWTTMYWNFISSTSGSEKSLSIRFTLTEIAQRNEFR